MGGPAARSAGRRSRRPENLIGWAVALVAATVLMAGCGGDGDSIATATDDDRLALEKITSQIEEAARSGDVEAFCDLVQPSLVKAAFGGRNGCITVSRSAMTPDSPLADLEITDLVTDGDGAIVTYAEDPPGQVLFARENGNWYIALDELARARRKALEDRPDAGPATTG